MVKLLTKWQSNSKTWCSMLTCLLTVTKEIKDQPSCSCMVVAGNMETNEVTISSNTRQSCQRADMLFSLSVIVWQVGIGHLNQRKLCLTLKKTSGQPFDLWGVMLKTIVLTPIRSLLVVQALEPLLLCIFPTLNKPNTKVKAAMMVFPLILTVSSPLQECLKTSSIAMWLIISSLKIANLT